MRWLDDLATWWLLQRRKRSMLHGTLQDFAIESLHYASKSLEITAIAPSLCVIADEAVALLEANNASNYVQFDMLASPEYGDKRIRITVQYAHGKSPAIKAAELEAELQILKTHKAI